MSPLEIVQRIVASPEFFDLLCQQRFGPQVGSPLFKAVPPGHFYSPLPSLQAVEALETQPETYEPDRCPGIELQVDEQLGMLRNLAPLVSGLEILDFPLPGRRYYADNGSFAPGDALLLAAMLLWARPRRVLEVGAGFSTALMLDVIDGAPLDGVSLEAIDPEPVRLRSLLQPGDERRFYLSEGLVQDVPLERFAQLRRNDILLIDSSHAFKLGSDVNFLLTQVLPRLAPGVLVRVHDVAWPFEYPVDHYRAGWVWNEAHALRLLLTNSPRYQIVLFSDYLVRSRREEVRSILPEFLRQRPGVPPEGNSACSFWLKIASG